MKTFIRRVSRKEFSNDPTEEMSILSLAFEGSITQIQKGVNRLTQYDTNREEVKSTIHRKDCQISLISFLVFLQLVKETVMVLNDL